MHLDRVRQDIHDFYLKLRMVDRLIETVEFERAYESAVDFRMLKAGIEELDVDIIKFFIILNRDPGELSLRELRRVAKHYNVPYWSRIDREELIKETTDQGLNSRTREVARQIDVLSDTGGDTTRDADRGNTPAGSATISRRIGIHLFAAESITGECSQRRERLSAGKHVGKHGFDGNKGSEGAEDSGESTCGPPILLES